MYSFLARQLTIMINRSMQRYMRVGKIMSKIGRKKQNIRFVFVTESFGELVHHGIDIPGKDAGYMQQGVAVFLNRLFPFDRDFLCRCFSEIFQVYIVPV